MKKTRYFVVFFLALFCLCNTALAKTCNYIRYGKYISTATVESGTNNITFKGNTAIRGYSFTGAEESVGVVIGNWNKNSNSYLKGSNIQYSAKEALEKDCPDYAIMASVTSAVDVHGYLMDAAHVDAAVSYLSNTKKAKEVYKLQLIKNKDQEIEIEYNNYSDRNSLKIDKNQIKGSMKKSSYTYGDAGAISKNEYKIYGYKFLGWHVTLSDGRFACYNKSTNEMSYSSSCSDPYALAVISDGASIFQIYDGSINNTDKVKITLSAVWSNNADVGPLALNELGSTANECSSLGYVWNKTDNGGYCNTDALQYIKCGDTYDIPADVPRIVSLLVNILKIATPIILIITSILTLVKSLATSKEDEIKKATSKLVKKVIAAAFVFFVIAIVQFVISKVADDGELGNMSDCLSCFLNNDKTCTDSKYFKSNMAGEYYCAYVGSPTTIDECNDFYSK